ncbi:hypothetical protein N7462_004859 [Penicillium macrosclerotiorum]|uniref:uncharacterized protein n=1 Tax=Penicillium macrosclerotiorum TaxID=303699 RepID=UPI002549763E|nr:uncharacterized protein N7462_004859 [Penicillium macrosclerotiorum]KAJ5690467.1 hypothetical protein N7462_004859 [Penicillium macrosclerotiorum]
MKAFSFIVAFIFAAIVAAVPMDMTVDKSAIEQRPDSRLDVMRAIPAVLQESIIPQGDSFNVTNITPSTDFSATPTPLDPPIFTADSD